MRHATILLAVVAVVALAAPAYGDDYFTATTGNWVDSTSWEDGSPPTSSDKARIKKWATSGHTTTILINPGDVATCSAFTQGAYYDAERPTTVNVLQTGGTLTYASHQIADYGGITATYTLSAGTQAGTGWAYHLYLGQSSWSSTGVATYNINEDDVNTSDAYADNDASYLEVCGHFSIKTGTFNQSAGTVKVKRAQGNWGMYLGYSSTLPTTHVSTYNLSGGDLSVETFISVGISNNCTSLFNMTGGMLTVHRTTGDSQVNVGSATASPQSAIFRITGDWAGDNILLDNYAQHANGTLSLVLDGTATGIEKIVVNNDVTITAGAELKVSASAALASGEYLLMTCGDTWTGSFTLVESLDGDWTLQHRDNGGVDELWLVPEPATMVLLGLGSLGVFIRRRRK